MTAAADGGCLDRRRTAMIALGAQIRELGQAMVATEVSDRGLSEAGRAVAPATE